MELAIALEARKQIVLVRECRENLFYKDEDDNYRSALASVRFVFLLRFGRSLSSRAPRSAVLKKNGEIETRVCWLSSPSQVAELRAECPEPMRRVFDQCVILEVRDYRDVNQRQQLVEHLVSGKYARTLHVNPGELTPWTKRRDKRKAAEVKVAPLPVAGGDG